MTLTALVGPPGAGKTAHAIDLLERAAALGKPTHAIVAADVARASGNARLLATGRFFSRNRRSWPFDGLVRDSELRLRLEGLTPGTLLVIEDAYGFVPESAALWQEASGRGIDVVLVAPSGAQMAVLDRGEWTRIDMTLPCSRCGQREGRVPVIEHPTGLAATYCPACFSTVRDEATAEMKRVLLEGGPHEGQQYLYQPIDIPGFEDWKVVRGDSPRRAALMLEVLQNLGITGEEHESYLDVGCLTGYFCDFFAQRGMAARGIDVTRTDIEVARILDNFYRRQARPNPVFVVYERHDGYDYLTSTQDDVLDVTSSLAVFQWIMLQRGNAQVGIECIRALANKTRRVMFLEMGYTDEDIYRDKLPVEIDRQWVQDQLREAGFTRTMVLDRTEAGIRRDIHVGIR